MAQKLVFCVVGTGPLRRLSIKNHPIWRGQNGQWLICRYYCAGFRSSVQSFGANESTHAFRSFGSYCTCIIVYIVCILYIYIYIYIILNYIFILCIYIYIWRHNIYIYMCVCIDWAYNIPVGKSTPWWVSGGTIAHISDVHVHSSSSSVDFSSSFFFIIIIIFYCFSCLLSTFIVSVWYGICVRAIYSWLYMHPFKLIIVTLPAFTWMLQFSFPPIHKQKHRKSFILAYAISCWWF